MKALSPGFILVFLFLFNTIQLIAQPCTPYPGYTTWMGYTSAWDDSSNWCPAIVPVNTNPAMNVRIPGGPAGPYTYYRPVIGAGVYALTNKLRIETNDTIFINATNQSSLTVNDSLKIQDPTSALIVNNVVMDTVQVSTDTISIPNDSPLNNHNRTRSFIVIPQAELLAQGMQANDVICKILLHIKRNSNGNPYRNCEVKYYQTNMPGGFGTGCTAIIPPIVGPTPLTIWSGDLYPPAYIPTMNGYGTIDLALQMPFQWNGSANPIVIEICYDNTGFPDTGFNDEIRFTQTAVNRYLSIRNVTDYVQPGCSMLPSDVINVSATWTAGSNTITLTNPSQVVLVFPGMIVCPGGQSVVSIVGTIITLDSPMPSNGGGILVLSNVRVVSSQFRPNMTFVIGCNSSSKYPIFVRGHWENNGTFVAGNSRVTFDGTIADQQIRGQSKTTFYDLETANTNNVLRMTDFTVQDSLHLTSGRLKLNLGMVTLLNPDPSAITQTIGYIQAETDQLNANVYPFGRIYWKMGSSTGMRVLPFVNSTGNTIYMDYNIVSGIHDVVLGTYGTLLDNTPLPLPEVTNVIANYNGVPTSSGITAVDRFYLVHDSLGINPVATVTFRYSPLERSVLNPAGALAMCAQRWINSLDIWEYPFVQGQAYFPDQVILDSYSVSDTADWWTITSCSDPLGTTSLQEINPEFICAYPNPAYPGDVLNLTLHGNTFHPEMVRIYSADGREIFNEKDQQGNTAIQIPSGLSPGIYTIQISDREKTGIVRLVILEQ